MYKYRILTYRTDRYGHITTESTRCLIHIWYRAACFEKQSNLIGFQKQTLLHMLHLPFQKIPYVMSEIVPHRDNFLM